MKNGERKEKIYFSNVEQNRTVATFSNVAIPIPLTLKKKKKTNALDYDKVVDVDQSLPILEMINVKKDPIRGNLTIITSL